MIEPITMALMGAGALSTVLGGFGQASRLKAEAKAAKLQEKYTRLQMAQRKAQNLENINDVVSSVNLVRSARGVNLDSATGRALRADRRRRGLDNLNNDNLSFMQQITNLQTRQANAKAQARVAPIIGAMQAAGQIGGALASGFGQVSGDATSTVDKIKKIGTSQLRF